MAKQPIYELIHRDAVQRISRVDCSPRGGRVVTMNHRTADFHVWDADSGGHLAHHQFEPGDSEAILQDAHAAWDDHDDPLGVVEVVRSAGSTTYVIDLLRGAQRRALEHAPWQAISTQGSYLFAVMGHQIRVERLADPPLRFDSPREATGVLVRDGEPSLAATLSLHWDEERQRLVSVKDSVLRVDGRGSTRTTAKLSVHEQQLAVARDDRMVIVGQEAIELWDLGRMRSTKIYRSDDLDAVNYAALSTNGRTLYYDSWSCTYALDLDTHGPARAVLDEPLVASCDSPKGFLLLTSPNQQRVRAYRADDFAE